MKVTAILKGKKDSLGRYMVYIRASDFQKRIYKATGIRVTKAEFKNGKTTNASYNAILKAKILALEAAPVVRLDMDLIAYANKALLSWEKTKKYSTLRQHSSEIKKIKEFGSVKLSRVNHEYLEKYADYCYSLGNKTNTVWKTLKFWRTVIRKAHREGFMDHNPFLIFKMPKYKDPQKTFLSSDQVKAIDKYCQDKKCPPELKFIGTWFVIGCKTGLRFGDMGAFDKKQIKGDRLYVYTQKTQEPVSFPVSIIKDYLERINYRRLDLTNEYCNRMIKVIAEVCEIEEKVTWHTSRHTFGTLAASAGIRREVIAKLMGHTDLRSTAIYSKLTDPTVDAELRKM